MSAYLKAAWRLLSKVSVWCLYACVVEQHMDGPVLGLQIITGTLDGTADTGAHTHTQQQPLVRMHRQAGTTAVPQVCNQAQTQLDATPVAVAVKMRAPKCSTVAQCTVFRCSAARGH